MIAAEYIIRIDNQSQEKMEHRNVIVKSQFNGKKGLQGRFKNDIYGLEEKMEH